MARYLIRRAIGTIPVVLLVTLLVYGLLHLAPGDPASLLLPEDATDADIAEARRRWGLDQPFLVQYVFFIGKALQHFGTQVAGVHVETGTQQRLRDTKAHGTKADDADIPGHRETPESDTGKA